MRLTNEQILNAKPSLEQLNNIKMAAKTAYKISKIISKLNRELKDIYAQQAKMVKDNGEEVEIPKTDAKGNPILDKEGNPVSEKGSKVKPENAETFTKEWESILSIEVDLDIEGSLLFIEEFVDKEGKELDIEPRCFENIEWLLK